LSPTRRGGLKTEHPTILEFGEEKSKRVKKNIEFRLLYISNLTYFYHTKIDDREAKSLPPHFAKCGGKRERVKE
jgi:hypothetical protein